MLPSFCDIMGATTGLVAALISWFWLLPFLQSSKQSCIVKDTNAMKRFATLCKMALFWRSQFGSCNRTIMIRTMIRISGFLPRHHQGKHSLLFRAQKTSEIDQIKRDTNL
jgi:hypothetical protein